MARPSVRPLNGRRPGVSHAKPPATEVDEEHDDESPSASVTEEVPAGPAPVDSLSEMMSGLQGANTARIHVYRIVKNQPPAYVFECDPTTFSLDDLRDKYNGGEFRLYIMKDSRLWRNMRVLVEPKQMFSGGHDPSPPAAQVADIVALMRESLAQQTAMIRDMLATRAPSPFSGMNLPEVITAAAAAITALRPPPAPPAPPPVDTTSQALEMFMRGMEIMNNVRESAPSGDNSIGGMLRDVLRSPIVAAAVQNAIPTAARPPQPPALPNPQPAQVSHAKTSEGNVVAAKPTDPQPTNQQEGTKMLEYYLGFLVGKARGGADASLYAELVLDNVPDTQLTPMLARGDQLIDDLIAIHAPVSQHREWFVMLIKEINELLASEQAPDDDHEQNGVVNAADPTPTVVSGHAAQ